jgi:integrase/recombinase XerD
LRSDTPLVQVFDSFFNSLVDKSPKTEEFYWTHFRGFQKFIQTRQEREPILEDFNREFVEAYLKWLRRQPTKAYPEGSPFRTSAAQRSLKRLGNWLAEDGVWAGKNGESVVRHLDKIKEPVDVRQPLSDDELEQVRAGAGRPGERDYTIIVFGVGTGLRLNELREARVGDLNLKERQFTVRPETSKSDRSRVVDFHDVVGRELDRYLRSRPVIRDGDALFITDEGTQFSEHGFKNVFKRIKARSGLKEFSAHLMRHTWATRFNGDLLELKRQGGWKDWKQVERYKHKQRPAPRDLVNPVDVMGRGLKPGTVTELRKRSA